MNSDTVNLIMADLLAACVAAFDDPAAPKAPEWQFTTWGQPAWIPAVSQLTVAFGSLSNTAPFPLSSIRSSRRTIVPSVLLNVECVRPCWPTLDTTAVQASMPTAEQFMAATEKLAADAATLMAYIGPRALVNGGLFPSLPTIGVADDVALQTMQPLGPTGQMAGMRWPITVKVSVP